MADKNVKIGIGVEGADEAAADVQKVTENIEDLGTSGAGGRSIAGLEGQLESLHQELRKLDVGSDAFRAMVPRIQAAEKALEAARIEAGAVVTSLGGNRGMGGTLQQLGYQVGDFAVQVGSGTSAMTAFAQQGSQMLGAFGPAGAIAGALLAVGAAIGSAMSRAKDDADEAAEASGLVDAAIGAAVERMRDLAAAQAEADGKAFAAGLQDQATRTKAVNDEIARGIELLRQRRVLELELVDAQAARKLAEVEANEGLTEPERIRQRAEIQRDSLAKRREAEIAGIREGTEPAAAAARQSKQELDDQTANLEKIRGAAAALKAEVEALEQAIKKSRIIDQQLEGVVDDEGNVVTPGLRGQRDELLQGISRRVAEQIARGVSLDDLQLDPAVRAARGPSYERDVAQQIIDLNRQIAALENSPDRLGPASPEATRLEEARNALAEREEELAKQETALTAAAEAARKAAQAYEEAAAEAKRTEEIRRRIYAEEDRKFDVETGKKTKDARKNALTYGPELPPGFGEEEDIAPEAKKVRKVADTLSGAGNASGAAKRILLDAIARAEADGTVTLQELQGLGAAIESALASLSARDDEQARELRSLKERFDNLDRNTRKKLRK
jgi:hypothetical protein